MAGKPVRRPAAHGPFVGRLALPAARGHYYYYYYYCYYYYYYYFYYYYY